MKVFEFLKKLFPEDDDPMHCSVMQTDPSLVFVEAGWLDISTLQKRFDSILEQEIIGEEEKELYELAIKKWGKDLQLIMVMEEMSELTKELSKHLRNGYNFNNIAEEVADVEIMLEQIKVVFSFPRRVEWHKEKKLKRLKELLEKKP